jgi:hypothetical protein
MLEEGLEPSRDLSHRILNPARLPIPPPEPGTRVRLASHPRTSGAEGNRTPDLLNAIQALSQLSYGPQHFPMTLKVALHPATRFSINSSGADGTRTRGLRCDRPAL